MSTTFNWSSPHTLSTTTVNSSNPKIVIDPNGNLVAVWIENGFVKASNKPVSGSWTSSSTISTTGASSLYAVIDSNGTATIIWLNNTIVYASSKTLTGSWSSASALSNTGASTPVLTIDNIGNSIAVWPRNGNIESSTKLLGSSWQNNATINNTFANSPCVAIGGTSTNTNLIAIVWHSTSTNSIYVSTKLLNSGGWSTPQVISDTNHYSGYPRVTVDQNTNITAVWYTYDIVGTIYSNVCVQSSYLIQSTGKWAPFINLSSGGLCNPANLTLSVKCDGNANVIAVWNTSFDGANFTVESAIKPTGNVWSTKSDIINSLYSLTVDMNVIPLGDALSTFMFYNGNSLLILISEMNTTGYNCVWSVPLNISKGTNNGFPNIACTLTGNNINAAVIWIQSNGTDNIIQVSNASRPSVLPPSNLTITQNANNLGIFTEYNNVLHWTASTDPNLAGYIIFRNGVLIAQTTARSVQYTDSNQLYNGFATYGIAAVNTQQLQSAIVNTIYA